jgi:GTPase SAR1 family protein
MPTIEDTYRHMITSNKMVFTLQITDTTGSHQFPAMQRLNIQKGHAFILVYSIVNRQSLEELKPIFRDIIDIKSAQQSDKQYLHIPMILIGSKCDEAASRTVPTALGEKLAQDYNCAFMEVIKMN